MDASVDEPVASIGRAYFNRFWRHLRANRTRWALGFCVAAVGFILWTGTDSSIGQALLVFLGAVVSIVLLPSDPYRVWDLSDNDLADIVPSSHLDELFRRTVSAILVQEQSPLPREYQAMIADEGLVDVRRVAGPSHAGGGDGASRAVIDMKYQIVLEPSRGSWDVTTTISSRRCIPGDGRVYVSYCSDSSALDHENRLYGCLCREIVPYDDGEDIQGWINRLQDSNSLPEVQVDGKRLDPVEIIPEVTDGSAILRFAFDSPPLAAGYCRVKISFGFRSTMASLTLFPVVFSAYRCIGPIEIVFDLVDSDARIQVIDFLSFGDHISDPPTPATHMFRGNPGQRVQIYVPEGTVLPAGAGVVFLWSAPSPFLESIRHVSAGVGAEIEGALDGTNLPAFPVPGVLPKQRQPIVSGAEADEALVDVTEVDGLIVIDAYARLGILPSRSIRLRSGVVYRLARAAAFLQSIDPRFGLAILDGYRTEVEQGAILRHYEQQQGPTEDFVSKIGPERRRAPHLTGGAVDLTLTWRGRAFGLGTDFDSFTSVARADGLDGRGAPAGDISLAGRLRRLLAVALTTEDLAPYPLEWWHWSYGDDVWATQVPGRLPVYEEILDDRPTSELAAPT